MLLGSVSWKCFWRTGRIERSRGIRREKRTESKKALEEAKESGDKEKRLEKGLLRLMGVPVVEAPGEAEAQCAELVRAGKVHATVSDMNALTFGSKVLLRNSTVPEFGKMTAVPVQEYFLDKVLAGMGMTSAQFIDLCILLGCDYCSNIKGVGPKKAVELIKKHGSIEKILKNIDVDKYQVPEGWHYKEARQLFLKPDVQNGDEFELDWAEPDVQGVVKLLVTENGFNEERVRTALDRLVKSRDRATQVRIDSFFKPTGDSTATKPSAAKRQKLSASAASKGKSPKVLAKGVGKWKAKK